MTSIKVLQLLIVFGIVHSSSATEITSLQRAGYEEPCNKTLKCKSQSWFGCNSETSTCLCLKPDEMTYDASKGKCLVNIGERCIFALDHDINSSLFEPAECIDDARCASGVCSCPFGTYASSDSLSCQPVKKFSETCSTDAECNKNDLLICNNGTCSCDPLTSINNAVEFETPETPYYYYSPEQLRIPVGVCLSKVGSSCSRDQHCVRNAKCEYDNSKCECNFPNVRTAEGLCGVGHGVSCSSSLTGMETPAKESGSVCHDDGLVCMSFAENSINRTTKCSCPDQLSQEYDNSTKTCRSRVWSPCNPNEVNSCTQNSTCQDIAGKHLCVCESGFIPNDNFKCQIAHGQPCDYNLEINSTQVNCDDVAGLECRNGKCTCPNSFHIYEEERRLCATPVGLSCSKQDQCVTNAICTTKKHELRDRNIPGKCECIQGFSPAANGTCGAA